MNNQLFDYDHVEVIKVKYPRQEIPEIAEENMELGGVYQEFIYKLGECLGCCRTYIPCCCCAEYPYKQIEQSFVGNFVVIQGCMRDLVSMQRPLGLACSTLTR